MRPAKKNLLVLLARYVPNVAKGRAYDVT